MKKFQKITPNLWFGDQAKQAARFYTSIFKNSKMGKFTYYMKDGHEIHGQKEGSVMTVEFQIEGQEFVALNGGPHFKFSEAISFIVNCETQEEVDYYWENLSEGGDPNAQQRQNLRALRSPGLGAWMPADERPLPEAPGGARA